MTMRPSTRFLSAAVALAALVGAACGESPQRLSPTGPSATTTATTASQVASGDKSASTAASGESAADATLTTTQVVEGKVAVQGAGGDQAVVTDANAVISWANSQPGWAMSVESPQDLEVEGTGPITAIVPSVAACPNVTLTIYDIPVTVNSGTIFQGSATCGSLTVGTIVRVRGLLSITGGVTRVTAVFIAVDADNEVEGEGRVLSVSGTCPTLTLIVDGITVRTDNTTMFVPSTGCADIRLGTKIRVRAVAVAGSPAFRARRVQVTGQREFMEGEGRITSVTGTCPTKTIFIGSLEVHVDGTTTYRGGNCVDLQPGVKIEAHGQRDESGGPILATSVEIEARHIEGEGPVTAISGSCTAGLTMTLADRYHVTTNAGTRYVDGRCADIRLGTRLEVKGDMLAADGSIIAESVEVKGQSGSGGGGGGETEGEGTITSVTGACPNRTIQIGGYTASLDSSTVYRNGSCGELAAGRRIRARAQSRSGGGMFVMEVEFR
jgi:hypothetical protein